MMAALPVALAESTVSLIRLVRHVTECRTVTDLVVPYRTDTPITRVATDKPTTRSSAALPPPSAQNSTQITVTMPSNSS